MNPITPITKEQREKIPARYLYMGLYQEIRRNWTLSGTKIWHGDEWVSIPIDFGDLAEQNPYVCDEIDSQNVSENTENVFLGNQQKYETSGSHGYVALCTARTIRFGNDEMLSIVEEVAASCIVKRRGVQEVQFLSIRDLVGGHLDDSLLLVRESVVSESGLDSFVDEVRHAMQCSADITLQVLAEPLATAIAEKVEEPKQSDKAAWVILYNGVPINERNELVKLASKDSGGEMEASLVNAVWDLRNSLDPETAAIKLIDLNPGLFASIDFMKSEKEKDDGIDLASMAEANISVSDIIVKATAAVMLNGGLSDHFVYLDSGEMIVNPECPPDLTQGNELLRRILEVKETGQKIENYSSWTMGMISDMLETYFQDRFDPTMVMEATNTSYNTYTTSLNVFRRRWHNRRKELSYTHHKEVDYAKISDTDKELVLDLSCKLRLSVAEQRKLLSFVRVYEITGLGDEEIEDTDELMQRIRVRTVSKNFMFYDIVAKEMRKFRGPIELVPQRAQHVINTDDKTMLIPGGTWVKIPEWEQPVRIEVTEAEVIEAEIVAVA